MSARRVRLLCNPRARGGRAAKALPGIERALAGHRIELRIERTESPAHAAQLAADAASSGEELAVFGGDGTVRIAAHALRESDSVMAILPGGRGNDFARTLGVPCDAVAACKVLVGGAVRAVDVGEAGGETFVGIASIGLESEVTPIANAASPLGARATYAGAMLLGLARWKAASFHVELEDERRQFSGYLAAAANSGCFGGGMRLAPDARLDDGLLDIVMIEDISRVRFLFNAPKVRTGTHVEHEHVHVLRAQAVRLDADRPFEVYADGDPLAGTPALVRAVPSALRVRVPAPRRA